MLPRPSSRCTGDCDCKCEIHEARKFIDNLPGKFENKNRKAVSIVHFDLKGSTRLMKKDAPLAINKMLLHNKMCCNIIEKNNGKVIKELGDAVLAFFKDPGVACECAVKVIRNLRKHASEIRTKVTVASGNSGA